MLALLLLLIATYLRSGVGRAQVSTAEKWLAHVPFSIYLGWITVATIANVTSLLDWLNWGSWGISAEAWTVIMLIAATAIASAVGLTRGDVAYMLVIVWAFAGIAIKHNSTPTVATTAWAMTELVTLMVVPSVFLQEKRGKA
jgi:hypothetical protein